MHGIALALSDTAAGLLYTALGIVGLVALLALFVIVVRFIAPKIVEPPPADDD